MGYALAVLAGCCLGWFSLFNALFPSPGIFADFWNWRRRHRNLIDLYYGKADEEIAKKLENGDF